MINVINHNGVAKQQHTKRRKPNAGKMCACPPACGGNTHKAHHTGSVGVGSGGKRCVCVCVGVEGGNACRKEGGGVWGQG